MSIFNLLTLVGGLALFLYGMDLMSHSLQHVSGKQLKSLMESLTTSKLKGVTLGLAITALIQSSSGTTVIVVGLVNSAIMSLNQAMNVIMGANIGTTVTAWILSLSSISSSNPLVQLLKPSSFSPVLSIIGVIMMMAYRDDKKEELGKVLIGFGILMFGMQTMSDAMKPLADIPEFGDLMLKFQNPVLGILAGAIITAVIQSSSASVGILQSLTSTGIIPFGAVLPIVMGQNIGTCATALISTIGAKRNAKRAGILHLLFNVIGSLLFIALVYIGNALFHFSFMTAVAKPFDIALAHTIMNIFAMIVLLPISEKLVDLAYLLVPITEEDRPKQGLEFEELDERLLHTPSIALEHCYDLSIDMFKLSNLALKKSIQLIHSFDTENYKEVKELENRVDMYEDRLGEYLASISHQVLAQEELKLQSLVLQTIGDFERMADHARNLSQSAKELHEKEMYFSAPAQAELDVYFQAVQDLTKETLQAYTSLDLEEAKQIEPFEELIDKLTDDVNARHIQRVTESLCSIQMGFVLTDIITNLERIADHCSNVGVAIIISKTMDKRIHDYKANLLKDSGEFLETYRAKREKYQLPEY